MSSEMRDCPFCGNKPRSGWQGTGVPGMDDCGYWGIDCCNAFAHADTEAEALAQWNRRSDAPNGSWLWCKLMDFCQKRRFPPAEFNDLFAIVTEAHELNNRALLARTEAGAHQHRWNDDGERCVKCGDKDWMGGPCSVPDAAPVADGVEIWRYRFRNSETGGWHEWRYSEREPVLNSFIADKTEVQGPFAHPQDASGDAEKDAEIARLNAIINSPQSDDFLRAVSTEAEHQRQRWGSDHDAGKTPADWFWLVGYLGGKALHSQAAGDTDKAEHHIITTAAACANWHRAMFGRTDMRPGIDGQAAMQAKEAK